MLRSFQCRHQQQQQQISRRAAAVIASRIACVVLAARRGVTWFSLQCITSSIFHSWIPMFGFSTKDTARYSEVQRSTNLMTVSPDGFWADMRLLSQHVEPTVPWYRYSLPIVDLPWRAVFWFDFKCDCRFATCTARNYSALTNVRALLRWTFISTITSRRLFRRS